jgi:hypothetical protein
MRITYFFFTIIFLLPFSTHAAFKSGGFMDFRFSNLNVSKSSRSSSGQPESGFNLDDGALYGNYTNEQIEGVIDIAFRRGKDIDKDSSASYPNQSSNNSLAFGLDKSQLFLRYKISPSVSIDAGQFDTIFGLEANDSKDRVFSNFGTISETFLPFTHTGLMLEYSQEALFNKTLIANPNSKGSLSNSSNDKKSLEFGSAFGFNGQVTHGQLGLLSRRVNAADRRGAKSRILLDALFGFRIGILDWDFQYSHLRDPNKNTLTSNVNDLEESARGYGSMATFKFSPSIQNSWRFEYTRNDPSTLGIKSSKAAGTSIHYKIKEELEFRTDFTYSKFATVSAEKFHSTRFNLGIIFSI